MTFLSRSRLPQRSVLLVPLIASLLAGCAEPAKPTLSAPVTAEITKSAAAATPSSLADVSNELSDSNNAFGLKLLKEEAQDKPRNAIVSPLSVFAALAMTHAGAAGATKAAMGETLVLGDRADSTVDGLAKQLFGSLRIPDEGAKLEVANALFPQKDEGAEAAFLNRIKAVYAADIQEVNYHQPPDATQTINGWVNEKTHGKIPTIVGNLSTDTVMVLANAVYFKGSWKSSFAPSATHPAPFTLTDGRTEQIQLMSKTADFGWFEGPGYKAASLPYVGERRSMYIFLPDKGATLASIVSSIESVGWRSLVSRFQVRRVQVGLPRYKLEFQDSLKSALTTLGMGLAFNSGEADFSGMFHEKVWVDDVVHRTFVDVNEEGTEAAAATTVMMAAAASAAAPPQLIVDRPFLFAIADRPTGTLLFVGAVQQP